MINLRNKLLSFLATNNLGSTHLAASPRKCVSEGTFLVLVNCDKAIMWILVCLLSAWLVSAAIETRSSGRLLVTRVNICIHGPRCSDGVKALFLRQTLTRHTSQDMRQDMTRRNVQDETRNIVSLRHIVKTQFKNL